VTPALARIAILLSGRGSNYVALQEAVLRGEVPATVVLVASDVESAPGLIRAREYGSPATAIPRLPGEERAAHEQRLLAALEVAGAEWVCLAGFMRILSSDFVRRYRNRTLNVHPSLLPAFPGKEAQRQALEHGAKVSGCTVHFVDAGVDSGPIIVQRAVPVLDGDTTSELARRILVEEHVAYPQALRRLLGEPWRLDGRRVVFGDAPAPTPESRPSWP
jgi:phosphoribosylglycinamide formyltransferase-1